MAALEQQKRLALPQPVAGLVLGQDCCNSGRFQRYRNRWHH